MTKYIFLRYIWSSATVPSSAPKILVFLSVENDKGDFCYSNEVTFGKHLRMGLFANGVRQ